MDRPKLLIYGIPKGENMADYNRIEVTSFAPGLGAEVRGIRLPDGRHDHRFAKIHRAYLNH